MHATKKERKGRRKKEIKKEIKRKESGEKRIYLLDLSPIYEKKVIRTDSSYIFDVGNIFYFDFNFV